MRALYALIEAVSKSADYWAPFFGACVLALVLVPVSKIHSFFSNQFD